MKGSIVSQVFQDRQRNVKNNLCIKIVTHNVKDPNTTSVDYDSEFTLISMYRTIKTAVD